MIRVVLLAIFLLQGACTVMEDLSSSSMPIEGVVKPWAQGATGPTANCQGKVVEVVGINSDGTPSNKVIGKTVAVKNDGSYRVMVATSSIQFLGSSKLNFLIRTRGCEENLIRPLTGFDGQDFEYGLLMVNRAFELPQGARPRLNTVTVDAANSLMLGFSNLVSTTGKNVYDEISANTSFAIEVANTLGIVFENLPKLGPRIEVLSAVTPVAELVNMRIQTQVIHWYYDDAYFTKEWTLQGVPHVETTSTIIVPTTRNSQGSYAYALRVGHPNPGGGIDTSLNTDTRNFTIVVSNTYPVTLSTALITFPKTHTNDRNYTFNVDTGHLNCQTFTKIVYSESATFNANYPSFDCTPGNEQITILLSNTDGAKTIRFWGIDSANNRNATAATRPVILKRSLPTLTFDALPSLVKGGDLLTITTRSTDQFTKIWWEISIDNGLTWSNHTSNLALNNVTSHTISFTVPALDGSVRFRARVEDRATNIGNLFSTPNVTVDATAPSALNLTLTSATPTNNSTVDISVAGCSGDAVMMLFQQTTGVPAINDARWEACGTSKAYTVLGADQNFSIYGFAKDAAGNISSISGAVTGRLDREPPVIAAFLIDGGLPTTENQNVTITFTLQDESNLQGAFIAETPASCADVRSSADSIVNATLGDNATSFTLTPSLGVKTLCFWAVDELGQESFRTATIELLEEPSGVLEQLALPVAGREFATDSEGKDIFVVDYQVGGGILKLNLRTQEAEQIIAQGESNLAQGNTRSFPQADLKLANIAIDKKGTLYFADRPRQGHKVIYSAKRNGFEPLIEFSMQEPLSKAIVVMKKRNIGFAVSDLGEIYTLNRCADDFENYELQKFSKNHKIETLMGCSSELFRASGEYIFRAKNTQMFLLNEDVFILAGGKVFEIRQGAVIEHREMQESVFFSSGLKGRDTVFWAYSGASKKMEEFKYRPAKIEYSNAFIRGEGLHGALVTQDGFLASQTGLDKKSYRLLKINKLGTTKIQLKRPKSKKPK